MTKLFRPTSMLDYYEARRQGYLKKFVDGQLPPETELADPCRKE